MLAIISTCFFFFCFVLQLMYRALAPSTLRLLSHKEGALQVVNSIKVNKANQKEV